MHQSSVRIPEKRLAVLILQGITNSRTLKYLNRFDKHSVGIDIFSVPLKGKIYWFWTNRKVLRNYSLLIVGSPPSNLSIIAYSVLRKRPILDAGWPLYDGVILSRKEYGFLALKGLVFFLVDLLSFHISKMVLLETEAQVNSVSHKYLLRRRKLKSLYTGLDESRFSVEPTTMLATNNLTTKNFVVLFRGGDQAEAGIEVLVDAISLLSNDSSYKFYILSRTLRQNYYMGENVNVEVVTEFLTDQSLANYFHNSDLVLGQLSNHPRLQRTIPHKFFEAAFFGKPYLTSGSGQMGSFVEKGLVFGFLGGDARDLVRVLKEVKVDVEERSKRGSDLRTWYNNEASQKVLASRFEEIINGVLRGD